MTPRARKLYDEWAAGQGAKIRAARPLAVYGACSSLARCLAETLAPEYTRLLLTTDQIAECDQRAVTSARNVKFGPPPADPEAWKQQLDQIRADWASEAAMKQAAE